MNKEVYRHILLATLTFSITVLVGMIAFESKPGHELIRPVLVGLSLLVLLLSTIIRYKSQRNKL